MKRHVVLALAFLSAAGAARAEVTRAAADGVLIEHRIAITAPPKKVFEALGQPGQWWNKAHTRSGDAANLSLATEAGGCFCERWASGGVEHGRVVYVERDKLVRLHAALGPLQEMGVQAVLSFVLTPKEDATELALTYRISGDPSHKLEGLAPVVDMVIGEAGGRLKLFAETGRAPEVR